MPQSLARVLIHLVFSTKNREPFLTPELCPKLYGYLGSVGRDLNCEVYRVGGVEDHVHIAIELSRTITLADLVKKLKQTSSVWIKEQPGGPKNFEWQAGYGTFSLGQSQLPDLLKYIEDQEAHHRKKTFQDEYREFLAKYGIKADERYVWD